MAARCVGKEDEEADRDPRGCCMGDRDRLGPSPLFGNPSFCPGGNFILHYLGEQELKPLRCVPAPGPSAQWILGSRDFPTFVSFLPLSVPLPLLAPRLLFPPCFVPQIPFPQFGPHSSISPPISLLLQFCPPKPSPMSPPFVPSVPGHSVPRQGLVLQAVIVPWSPGVTQPPIPTEVQVTWG